MRKIQMFGSVFEPEKMQPDFNPLGNEGGIDGVEIWRCSVPGQSNPRVPMITVCTIEDDDVRILMDELADPFDVIEDHTTWIWFTTREAWSFAWRIARCLKRGGQIVGAEGDALIEVMDGALWIKPSALHVKRAA